LIGYEKAAREISIVGKSNSDRQEAPKYRRRTKKKKKHQTLGAEEEKYFRYAYLRWETTT
jgi:hypothetical protein